MHLSLYRCISVDANLSIDSSLEMHLTLCRFISVDASLSIDAQDHILCSEQPSLVQPLCDRELDETKAAASGPDWTALDRGKENLSAKQARLDCLTSPGKERISR